MDVEALITREFFRKRLNDTLQNRKTLRGCQGVAGKESGTRDNAITVNSSSMVGSRKEAGTSLGRDITSSQGYDGRSPSKHNQEKAQNRTEQE